MTTKGHSTNQHPVMNIAYYTTGKQPRLTVYTPGRAALVAVLPVSGKREAAKICRVNGWKPWNF